MRCDIHHSFADQISWIASCFWQSAQATLSPFLLTPGRRGCTGQASRAPHRPCRTVDSFSRMYRVDRLRFRRICGQWHHKPLYLRHHDRCRPVVSDNRRPHRRCAGVMDDGRWLMLRGCMRFSLEPDGGYCHLYSACGDYLPDEGDLNGGDQRDNKLQRRQHHGQSGSGDLRNSAARNGGDCL